MTHLTLSAPETIPATTREQQLRAMLSALAHDLSAPVRNMVGFTQHLQHHLPEKPGNDGDKQTQRCLSLMLSEGERAQKMLKALSVFSRLMTSSNDASQLQPAEILQTICANRPCTLNMHNLPVIQADAGRVFQLFDELVSNTLAHQTPEHATAIEVRYIAGAEFGVLQLADNGPGLAADQFERIKLPFYKGPLARDVAGVGMGLTYCDLILQQIGGNLSFAANQPHGLVVNCHIPNHLLGSQGL
jgi:signal transduction histidine kinase